MAQLAGVSTEEYEDFYFRACLVDYDKMGRAMRHLEKLMDRTDRVHIIAPGTDLTFSIQGIPCYATVSYTHLDVYKRQTLLSGKTEENGQVSEWV